MAEWDEKCDDPECDACKLGDDCEYGCDGPCENLSHWRDRARYFFRVSESAHEARDLLSVEGDELRVQLDKYREALGDIERRCKDWQIHAGQLPGLLLDLERIAARALLAEPSDASTQGGE